MNRDIEDQLMSSFKTNIPRQIFWYNWNCLGLIILSAIYFFSFTPVFNIIELLDQP